MYQRQTVRPPVPALAERYKDAGVFGPTLIASILYMITSGCTASTQYAYAEMLRLSTEGKINFVEDTREYARRAERMKKIFTDNGFHIVYDYDATQWWEMVSSLPLVTEI